MSNKILSGAILIIVAVFGVYYASSKHQPTANPKPLVASLSSLNTGPAPWQPEYNYLPNRLKAIGLTLLGAEGTAQHIHSHLDIYISGKQVSVPAEIGIPPTGGITPIHTHDSSGIIHIESPAAHAIYTLGQFFDIWGVRLTNSSIGGYANNTSSKLIVYSNGHLINDPSQLPLTAHEEIAITYGTAKQSPNIPTSYSFPAGL